MANNIAIQISANAQQAVAGIQTVNQKLDQMQKSTETASSRFIRISAVMQGSLMIFNRVQSGLQLVASAVSACTGAYSVQEQAERRLQTTLTATQNAVGMSASELFNLADALSSVTTYSDQEIIAVEQMLASTRKIGRDIMPEAIKAVLDMAAATGDDAVGAAHDLAQALADPAGEIESLKEKGIQLSEEQKKNIQRVQEQNGVYEAQKILLQEVAGTYGGMAEAIAETDTGKLQQIKNVWEDIKEGLGEGLMNSLGPALDWIYDRLNDISGWIDEQNSTHDIREEAETFRSSGATDLSSASSDVLREIIANSDYGRWLQEYNSSYPDAYDSDRWDAAYRLVGTRFSQEDMLSYNAAAKELESRERLARLQNLWTTQDIVRNDMGFRIGVSEPWQDVISGSVSAYNEGILRSGRRYAAASAEESVAAGPERNSLADFISSNISLSSSAQIEAINEKIRESSRLMLEVDPDSEAYKQLNEINDALWEQKDALLDNQSAVEAWKDEFVSAASSITLELFNLFDSSVSLIQTLADNAADSLDAIEDKWDEYFDKLEDRQEEQRDSLNAMLASGNISYEDYIDAMNDLDESRSEAEEKRAEEEEEARAKANELGKAAFEANKANQIAQVAVSTAVGIAKAWEQPYYVAIPLTALIGASSAVQIATIAAQQYTPMAAGGIVTSPTQALIGEGSAPEAVLPLTDGNMERFGLGSAESGVINLTINIGAVYSKEDLADEIFHGIERAQRTGALPNWRYA